MSRLEEKKRGKKSLVVSLARATFPPMLYVTYPLPLLVLHSQVSKYPFSHPSKFPRKVHQAKKAALTKEEGGKYNDSHRK